jgi:hypothetical protein
MAVKITFIRRKDGFIYPGKSGETQPIIENVSALIWHRSQYIMSICSLMGSDKRPSHVFVSESVSTTADPWKLIESAYNQSLVNRVYMPADRPLSALILRAYDRSLNLMFLHPPKYILDAAQSIPFQISHAISSKTIAFNKNCHRAIWLLRQHPSVISKHPLAAAISWLLQATPRYPVQPGDPIHSQSPIAQLAAYRPAITE